MHRGGVVGESFDFGLVEFVFGERVCCCALVRDGKGESASGTGRMKEKCTSAARLMSIASWYTTMDIGCRLSVSK